MSELVWYVAYGSNLLLDRFACYILGGKPPGGTRRCAGARDPSPPLAEGAQFLPHRLYFAHEARGWQGGGVAFVDPSPDPTTQTLGRRYLITREQFVDLLRQENIDPELDLPLDLDPQGRTRVGDGRYGLVLGLGEFEGHPLLACTNSSSVAEAPINPPSKPYLQCVIAGLRETFALNKQGVRKYLEGVPGIAERYPAAALGKAFVASESLLAGDE
jgi:hypothetical protein